MSAATMNEMERLRRERDEAGAERDALAAHVEEVRRVRSIPRAEFEHDGRRFQLLAEAIDRPPTTSLARLKAQWQAEALESLAADAHPHIRIWLKGEAKKLRRQAQDPTNGHH